jgi:hypothetical protein
VTGPAAMVGCGSFKAGIAEDVSRVKGKDSRGQEEAEKSGWEEHDLL